jgi:hypothetical protein
VADLLVHHAAVAGEGVPEALVAADELLHHDLARGRHAGLAGGGDERVQVVGAPGPGGAGRGERLEDDGEPTRLTNALASSSVPTSADCAQRIPRAWRCCFILYLSRTSSVCSTRHAGDAGAARASAAGNISASTVDSSLWTHGPRRWMLRTAFGDRVDAGGAADLLVASTASPELRVERGERRRADARDDGADLFERADELPLVGRGTRARGR